MSDAAMSGSTSLALFMVATLTCHGPLSPFLPATFEPILLLYGRLYPPLLIAVLGAVVSTAAEWLNYYLYRALFDWGSLARVMRSRGGRVTSALFARHPFLAVWVCAWSPLPDWAARILASHGRYSVRRYLFAFMAGRLPKFWLIAAIGLRWMPSGRALALIIAGSMILSAFGLRTGRRHRVPADVTRVKELMPSPPADARGAYSARRDGNRDAHGAAHASERTALLPRSGVPARVSGAAH